MKHVSPKQIKKLAVNYEENDRLLPIESVIDRMQEKTDDKGIMYFIDNRYEKSHYSLFALVYIDDYYAIKMNWSAMNKADVIKELQYITDRLDEISENCYKVDPDRLSPKFINEKTAKQIFTPEQYEVWLKYISPDKPLSCEDDKSGFAKQRSIEHAASFAVSKNFSAPSIITNNDITLFVMTFLISRFAESAELLYTEWDFERE